MGDSGAFKKSPFTFVWLDGSIHQSQQNLDLQKQILGVTSAFRPYDDKVKCETFIRSAQSDHAIILIASGGLSQDLVPRIHQLRQLTFVYVYCMKKEYMEAWSKSYEKV